MRGHTRVSPADGSPTPSQAQDPTSLHLASVDNHILVRILHSIEHWWDRIRAAQVCRAWRHHLLGPGGQHTWREVEVLLCITTSKLNEQGMARRTHQLTWFAARHDWFRSLALTLFLDSDEGEAELVTYFYSLLGILGPHLEHLALGVNNDHEVASSGSEGGDYSAPEPYLLGEGGAWIALLPRLQSLTLLTANYPDPQHMPSGLQQLELPASAEGSLDPRLGALGGLQDLTVHRLCLDDNTLAALAQLPGLRSLTLPGVELEGLGASVPGCLALPDLECLDVYPWHARHRLPDASLAFLRRLPSLRSLTLRGCGLEQVPGAVRDLPLRRLLCGGNRMHAADFIPAGRYLATLHMLGFSSQGRYQRARAAPAAAVDSDSDDPPGSDESGSDVNMVDEGTSEDEAGPSPVASTGSGTAQSAPAAGRRVDSDALGSGAAKRRAVEPAGAMATSWRRAGAPPPAPAFSELCEKLEGATTLEVLRINRNPGLILEEAGARDGGLASPSGAPGAGRTRPFHLLPDLPPPCPSILPSNSPRPRRCGSFPGEQAALLEV
uniref:F-box domain-containing protein n=1 Tax=Auxenochlorella protothecoides TaxID=3075 RepID=A0A1D1ZWF2_AUXPR